MYVCMLAAAAAAAAAAAVLCWQRHTRMVQFVQPNTF
jgi:hypothetical protein